MDKVPSGCCAVRSNALTGLPSSSLCCSGAGAVKRHHLSCVGVRVCRVGFDCVFLMAAMRGCLLGVTGICGACLVAGLGFHVRESGVDLTLLPLCLGG